MSGLKYISKDYEPKGDIEGFPSEVIDKMIERQVEQGNPPDVSVFEREAYSGEDEGGFNWDETEEEEDFWSEVIDGDFDLFFSRYPKKETVEQGQWVPAKDFGVFEVDEYGRWEALTDVKFLGAIINDEGDRIHFNLFMFEGSGFLEWDNEVLEFVNSNIPVENLTHCAPYPKFPEPKVEDEIWDLVNGWCDGQYKDVPDMNRRYLMDKILDWYNKKKA